MFPTAFPIFASCCCTDWGIQYHLCSTILYMHVLHSFPHFCFLLHAVLTEAFSTTCAVQSSICMFPTAFPIFASCWQVVKRKPRNIMWSTNIMQTSQLSWCHRESDDFSADLMISQQRPRFSWSTFPDHDRPSHTTGDFNPFCWTITICCQKCGLKASACRIAPYTTHSPIIELDLRVLHCVHGG